MNNVTQLPKYLTHYSLTHDYAKTRVKQAFVDAWAALHFAEPDHEMMELAEDSMRAACAVDARRYEGEPRDGHHAAKLSAAIHELGLAMEAICRTRQAVRGISGGVSMPADAVKRIPLNMLRAVYAYWIPAVRDILRHSKPAQESEVRQRLQDEANQHLQAFATMCGKASTCLAKIDDERERWQQGFGVIDALFMMLDCLLRLTALQTREGGHQWVGDAGMPYLAARGNAWLYELHKLSEHYAWKREKHRTLVWGRANGGVSPRAAGPFHTRDSKW